MKRIPGLYRRGRIYWLAVQREGARTFLSLKTDDLSEAVRLAEEMRESPRIVSGAAVKEASERFLAYKRRQGELTASSVDSRGYILRAFAAFVGNRRVFDVTEEHVRSYYAHARDGRTESTAVTHIMVLRSFFRWAVEVERLAQRNPVKAVKLARVNTRGRLEFCTAEERDNLIRECPWPEIEFVLYCGFHAGLRRQEIVEAKAFWFDLNAGLLHLRKHPGIEFKDREERTIPLTRAFQAFLARYGLHEPYMLRPDVVKKRYKYRFDFRTRFENYMEAKGMPWVSPHVMRHTFASLLASAGVSIFKISTWLGDDVRVTQRHYAKLLPNDLDIEKAF